VKAATKSGARLFGAGRFAGVTAIPGRKADAAAAAPASSAKRRLIALVHIAKKDLGLCEDDYRGIILDVAGVASAKDCSEGDLIKLVERFKARGWKPAQPAGRTRPKPADHKTAAKARALWLSLHALGAIDDPSERALEAFARRQLGCDRLQWANQALAYRLIEALKAMAERNGWSQALDGVKTEARVIVLKRRLVEALMGKLWACGACPAGWNVNRAAHEFAGMEIELLFATASELDIVAREFGRVLRATKEGNR
jgi:phage gp16-like protein